jgi:hypothetical protein
MQTTVIALLVDIFAKLIFAIGYLLQKIALNKVESE